MRRRLRHLPEQAAQCLACACKDPMNLAARELLFVTDAMTASGVEAALYIAGIEHDQVVALAREAIAEQRQSCEQNGPFNPAICTRYPIDYPIAAGEGPVLRIDGE